MSILDKLYNDKARIETEIKLIRKQIRNASRSEKRIEQKLINKKIEESHIENLLKLKDEKQRRSSRKNIKQETLSTGEGESDRRTTPNKRIQKSKDNQRIQERGGEDRPESRKEKRPNTLAEREVDPGEALPGNGRNSRLRGKQGSESVPASKTDRRKDSYYIARTNRKSREKDTYESSETEGSESSDENEMD